MPTTRAELEEGQETSSAILWTVIIHPRVVPRVTFYKRSELGHDHVHFSDGSGGSEYQQ